MKIHIFFIFASILFIILSISFAIYKKYKDFSGMFLIFAICSILGGVLSGISIHADHNYRSQREPMIDDVNNGYAKISISYITTIEDSISVDTVYSIVWAGSNQKYERYINDIEETYYWKNNKK